MPEDVTPLPETEVRAGLPAVVVSRLTRRERDYVMLSILVRIQHMRHAEAMRLVEALLAMGERTPDVLLAKAVIESALDRCEDVLDTIRELDRLDPPEIRAGRRIDERVRVRSFMKARATYRLTGQLDAEGRASLDFYLRQGGGGARR